MKLIFKIAVFISFGFLSILYANAQAPVINSVDHYSNASGSRVTLIGSNFGTDATKLVVHFGAVKATILSITNQIIETAVPPGATFENISVTNTTTGLTGYSNDQFLLSFGGEHPFTAANLQAQVDFAMTPLPPSGITDLCMCDLDGDGKNDIASVATPPSSSSPAEKSIVFYRNNSSVGSLNFIPSQPSSASIVAKTIHARCGDLDGDGKSDLVISRDGEIIDILRNTSTVGSLNFSPSTLTLTGRRPQHIEIADLDIDGKPEIIVTDQGAGNVYVFHNTSTLGAISFDPSYQVISIVGAISTDALVAEDINADHLPDIIVGQFLSANSNLFIIQNESTPGNFKLSKQTTLTVPGTIVNIRIGDLDGDQKPDIAATQYLTSSISILLNQGSNGLIQFSSINTVITDTSPWGLDFGDLDGDGKPDIAISSVLQKFTVLNNNSTPGNLSFSKISIAPTDFNRHVRIGDLDGDSKPDIAFTSTATSKISIFRNKSCLVPKLDPAGPLTICSSYPLRLNSNQSAGVTYNWKIDGAAVVGTNAFFDVTAIGSHTYTVTAVSEGGSCSEISNAVQVTMEAGGTPGPPTFINPSPVCINSTMALSVSSAGDSFEWTTPTGSTLTGNPLVITNFKTENAGIYTVAVKIGTCIAMQSSVAVEAVILPDFKVGYVGSEVVCSGDSKTLSTSPSITGFTYQWFEKTNGIIAGQITTSYSTSASGEFYYQAKSITSPACPAVESNLAKISVVSIPVVAFNAPAESCKNGIVQFTNQSVTDSQATSSYLWDFGDGQTSTLASPTHSFSTIQTFNVKLSVSYVGGSCPEELTKSIKISAAPIASITTPTNTFKFCSGASLKLEVNGTFSTYLWSTTETSSTINVTQPGTYIVDATTSGGCKLTLTQKVEVFSSSQVTVTATPDQISSGESVLLSASGLISYDWNPGKLVSDSTIANPTTLPLETILFTVAGEDSNGCPVQGTIEVKVKGESAVSRLKPSNFFSPNGDAINSLWSIDNILNFPQCSVTIYDDKGVKLYEAKPYMNDWDGSSQGKLLPNGVYFYIIRCEGEENTPKAGSITLIR